MAGVIKGGFYGNNIIINGEVDIDNGSAPVSVNRTIKGEATPKADAYTGEDFGGDEDFGEKAPEAENETEETTPDNAEVQAEIKAQLEDAMAQRQRLIDEGGAEKERLIKDGTAIAEKAKKDTEKLILKVKNACEKMQADAELEAKELREKAKTEGHDQGFAQGLAEGEKKGYDEGYVKGLTKCRDTLIELKNALESFEKEKESYFKTYEHQIFNTIFDIAQKITLDSLKQKDKAVLQKMLKQAAKDFLTSENVKITLSALDVNEEVGTDIDTLRSCFRENQHVEFEVLKDAPSGTLIIDNGSEITDAGIPTQLKMIGELGSGKYRDKPDSNPPKADSEPAAEPEPNKPAPKPLDEMTETEREEIELGEATDEIEEPDIIVENAEEPEAKPEKPKVEKTEKQTAKRPRKATNPLLSKMMGKLENSEE